MDKLTRNWLIVFGILIALIIWFLYQQHKTITSIISGLKDAVDGVRDFLQQLKLELEAIEKRLKEEAANVYSAYKSALDEAKKRVNALIQKAKALGQRVLSDVKEDLASAKQNILDEMNKIRQDASAEVAALRGELQSQAAAIRQKAEAELAALRAGLQSHEAAIAAALEKLKQEVGDVVSFIMNEIVPFLCKNVQIKSFLATGQFSIIDIASCQLKPVSGTCPRGTYGDTCQYLMCSGGTVSGGIYDWQTANQWCSDHFATKSKDSKCVSSSGLCVPAPLPVITGT